ncbi:MAG: pyridoxal phosphate-dependent aminotransferase [Aequorivita sp.]|nr:pyridoxal phosphate-dependent aminotransferase [Aequorivita sp.]|tara:strand:- start:5828 stop:6964 length:1137 start_codon:yes stop_codon:yes gene_type:complete
MNDKIYLSSPHMGGTEQGYVTEALSSNWISSSDLNLNKFEYGLETYLGAGNYITALSSGTAAIHLSLIMLGVGQDDEVLCQSMTFSASANPIVYQGATPVFIDSEPDTWNLCPVHLESAIKDRISKGKKPKAIVAVHLYGMPCKVDEITAISKKYDIPLIEDSAEALGSSYKGKKCGTFGHFSILSFNGNKIITTSGGGALVCRDQKNKEHALFLATQARDEAPHYQHSHIGYNYRMSNVCAGIGRGQMEVLDKHVALRQEMHAFYKEIFLNISEVSVFEAPNNDYISNHWLSCIRFNIVNNKFNPDGLREALLAENIESRPLWKPMHLQPIFKNSPYYGNTTCETLFNTGLCLPSGSNLTETDRQRIATTITKYFNS